MTQGLVATALLPEAQRNCIARPSDSRDTSQPEDLDLILNLKFKAYLHHALDLVLA